MNVPFALSMTASNVGLLWNPAGTSVSGSVANTILSGLAADQQLALGLSTNQLMSPIWLTSLSVNADAAGTVSFGLYDLSNTTFYPVYKIALPANGSLQRMFLKESGLYLPLNANQFAAFKSSATLNLYGDVGVLLVPGPGGPGSVPAFPTS